MNCRKMVMIWRSNLPYLTQTLLLGGVCTLKKKKSILNKKKASK